MELFDPMTGCLTDEGLQALTAGGLDELARLEIACKAEVSNMKDIVSEMVPTYKRKQEV